MSLHDDDRLDEIEARLAAERPRLSAPELDRLMLRCQSRRNRTTRRKEPFMRSRFAITAMLVLGLILSSTGVGLAVSGSSGGGSAGDAQYPTTPPVSKHHNGGGVLGTTKGNGNGSAPSSSSQPTPQAPVQAARQLSAPSGSSQLPFTGFAVIPVILAGVALLVAGLVLRRRSSGSRAP